MFKKLTFILLFKPRFKLIVLILVIVVLSKSIVFLYSFIVNSIILRLNISLLKLL